MRYEVARRARGRREGGQTREGAEEGDARVVRGPHSAAIFPETLLVPCRVHDGGSHRSTGRCRQSKSGGRRGSLMRTRRALRPRRALVAAWVGHEDVARVYSCPGELCQASPVVRAVVGGGQPARATLARLSLPVSDSPLAARRSLCACRHRCDTSPFSTQPPLLGKHQLLLVSRLALRPGLRLSCDGVSADSVARSSSAAPARALFRCSPSGREPARTADAAATHARSSLAPDNAFARLASLALPRLPSRMSPEETWLKETSVEHLEKMDEEELADMCASSSTAFSRAFADPLARHRPPRCAGNRHPQEKGADSRLLDVPQATSTGGRARGPTRGSTALCVSSLALGRPHETDEPSPQLVHLREEVARSAENAEPALARTLGPSFPFDLFALSRIAS